MVNLGQANALTLVVVIVAVVASGILAATIGSVIVYTQDEDTKELIGHQQSIGDEFDVNVSGEADETTNVDSGTSINLKWCVRFLNQPSAVMGILAGMFGLLYLVYLRFNLATALLSGTFIVPVIMISYFFLTNCPQGAGEAGQGLFSGADAIAASSEGLAAIPAIPPEIAAALVVGFTLIAAVVLFSMTGQDEAIEESAMAFEPEPDAADFARAAQRARERIEEANIPVDNAVYQAWLEMTGLLSLENPETTAPYEFAEEAIAVGLAEEDVTELTELFTDVRYGEKDPDTREDRALRVLRNIEETYQQTVVGDERAEE